jgi:hypothetical protein
MLFSVYNPGHNENLLTPDLANLTKISVVQCAVVCSVLASYGTYYFHHGGDSGEDCRLGSSCHNVTGGRPQGGVWWHKKVSCEPP